MDASNDNSYRGRLAQFRILEESRHSLIEELLDKLEKTESELRQTALDLKSEQDVRRRFQEEARVARDRVMGAEKDLAEAKYKAEIAEDEVIKVTGVAASLEENLNGVKDEAVALRERVAHADRQPVVVLLLDANVDCLLFHDKYYSKGFRGGEKAAEELVSHVHEYLRQVNPALAGIDVVIKAYADLETVEDVLLSEGRLRNHGQLRSFATGFSSRLPLGDFVDLGGREDATINKLKDASRYYASTYQCKHLILGCAITRQFISFLEKWAQEPSVTVGNVTLLENSFSPVDGFMLPFRTASFPGVFKSPKKVSRLTRHQLQLEAKEDNNSNQPTVLVIRQDASPSRRGGNKASDTNSVVIQFGPDGAMNTNNMWSEKRRLMG